MERYDDSFELWDQNYEYRTFFQEPELPEILVENGIPDGESTEKSASVQGIVAVSDNVRKQKLLLRDDEKIQCRVTLKKKLTAPVKKGDEIGRITFLLNGGAIASYPVTADHTVEKISYLWCVDQVFHKFFHE